MLDEAQPQGVGYFLECAWEGANSDRPNPPLIELDLLGRRLPRSGYAAKPRVAASATLGTEFREQQPQRGCDNLLASIVRPDVPLLQQVGLFPERHNPVGVEDCMQTVSLGSRETRQPRAMLRNRFAVLTRALVFRPPAACFRSAIARRRTRASAFPLTICRTSRRCVRGVRCDAMAGLSATARAIRSETAPLPWGSCDT